MYGLFARNMVSTMNSLPGKFREYLLYIYGISQIMTRYSAGLFNPKSLWSLFLSRIDSNNWGAHPLTPQPHHHVQDMMYGFIYTRIQCSANYMINYIIELGIDTPKIHQKTHVTNPPSSLNPVLLCASSAWSTSITPAATREVMIHSDIGTVNSGWPWVHQQIYILTYWPGVVWYWPPDCPGQ